MLQPANVTKAALFQQQHLLPLSRWVAHWSDPLPSCLKWEYLGLAGCCEHGNYVSSVSAKLSRSPGGCCVMQLIIAQHLLCAKSGAGGSFGPSHNSWTRDGQGFSPRISNPNPSKYKCRALRYEHFTVKSHIVSAPPESEITKSCAITCSSP